MDSLNTEVLHGTRIRNGLSFGTGVIPKTDYETSSRGQERKRKYRESEKGKSTTRNYNHGPRSDRRVSNYLEKPFTAWDGEGINEDDGSHTYVLLANSKGQRISKREGIPTKEIFELFLTNSGDKTIHVIYGGNYDFNMTLRDLPKEALYELYVEGVVWWERYRIEWRAGKSFCVYHTGRRLMIYDVLPFFQRSFVMACDEFLGADWPFREQIVEEKKNRGNFDYERITDITEYNDAELVTLVNLCTELRNRLNKADIRISRWDGPGAIATCLYKKYQVKPTMGPIPEFINEIATYAYAGGRFEIIRKGHSPKRCYQYDIRSAYPSAMRELVCLAHGEWKHVQRPAHIARFGVYRIRADVTHTETQPMPLWRRNKNGTVYFHPTSHNWYWTPEAQIAWERDDCEIIEGWEYETNCECNPFSFVEPIYNKRAALKKAGDGAHVSYKLGLNSLYGKLAQQIGWEEGPPLKLPPFHNLVWAGYVTSHCRAQIYRAALLAPNDVIAFETDAIFSRKPLPLPLGERLGEWDLTEYNSLTYLKSGLYWGTLRGKHEDECSKPKCLGCKEIEKSRGINKGSIARSAVIRAIRNGRVESLPAEQTRFITLGQALSQNFAIWTHWITSPRNIKVALWGKRIDVWDSQDNHARTNDGWEETLVGMGVKDDMTALSTPYDVEWMIDTIWDDEAPLADIRLMQAHEVYE